MVEKVALNLKVSTLTKAMIAECARLEHRTVSAYVDAMVEMDMKSKKLTPEMLQPAKSRTVKDVKVEDIPELPSYLDRELWAEWVEYKTGRGKPMLASTVKYAIREMMKAHANGWDVNELLREALAKQWQGFVFDKHTKSRGESSDLLSEDEQHHQRNESMFGQLVKLTADGLVTPSLYHEFIIMLKETDQLIDVPQMLWMFDQFKMINKGPVWNDSILQRAVADHHVFNEKGKFDVLRAGERI